MIKTLLISVILSVVLFFNGCSIYNPTAEFVQQRYTNSISYFNTFYNAERLFVEAEDAALAAEREFRETPNQTRVFTIPAAARTKFTASIEKNSKVLSFYPNSKWVDDALLMIGKAYYYTDDDVRAERKFLELSVKYPESDLAAEGQLWLGRSLFRQKKNDQALTLLEELIEKTKNDQGEIAGMAFYEIGKFHFGNKEYEKAEKNFSQALLLLDEDEILASIQFQIAQCYDNREMFKNAEVAYAKVREYGGGYTVLFNADLSRTKTIARQNRFDEALEILNDMLDDTKNFDFYGSINLEIANTLMAKGKTGEAIEKYIFIDTAFARTDVAARSYFALGKYFETVGVNYDSARNYYGRAKTEFPASQITAEAATKSDIFTKYDALRKDLQRYDTLLTNMIRQKIVDDSTTFFVRDSVKKAEDTLSVAEQPRKASSPGKKGEPKRDSIPTVDSTAIKNKIMKDLAHRQMLDSLQRSIVRTKFEFGGLFFVELQIPDSALYWFNYIVTNYPESEYAPRALYTIAEIYRSFELKPQSVRDSLYRFIITSYPASQYAQESRKILGVPLAEKQKDPALELFERAEQLADSNRFESAISVLRELNGKYPESPLRSKALYSIGWQYENSIKNTDSALAVYRRLISEFPTTQFAGAVRTKVAEYDNEMKKIEMEKQQKIDEQKKKEREEKEKQESQNKKSPATPDSLVIPKNKL